MQNVNTYAPLPDGLCAGYKTHTPGEFITIDEAFQVDFLWGMSVDTSRVVSTDYELTQDRSKVTDRRWYHGTTRKFWDKEIMKDDIMVHLGSLDSALHRITATHADLDDMNFFEITLDENLVKVMDEITFDWNYETVTPIDVARKDYGAKSDENAFLYYNEWEVPGSLSLHLLSSTIKSIRPMKLEEVL